LKYLKDNAIDVTPEHGVDNLAMAMSLPWSVVSRPLEGEAPTIDRAIGYSRSNTSPVLKLFLSRAEELM
jgi:LysR family hca operon transcriptional activator